MKNLVMIFAIIALQACSNSNSKDDESMDGFNLENQVYLSFKNSAGQNLLDPSTENSFNVDSFKLYYLIDDEPVEVTIENGYNMGSTELTSDKLLKVFTNFSISNIISETSEYNIVENIAYLQLSETDTDTIKTHSLSKDLSHTTATENCCYFLISKVWYNDELVWERETGKIIEITKK